MPSRRRRAFRQTVRNSRWIHRRRSLRRRFSSASRSGPEALDRGSTSSPHRSGNGGQRSWRVGHGAVRTVLLLLHVLDGCITGIVLGGLAAALSFREAQFPRVVAARVRSLGVAILWEIHQKLHSSTPLRKSKKIPTTSFTN